MARLGRAGQGAARQGEAGRGAARRGEARRSINKGVGGLCPVSTLETDILKLMK